MMRRLLYAAALLGFCAAPAPAYIEALTSLSGVVKESDVVAKAMIDAVSLDKKVVILKVAKPVKGKPAYERVRIDLNAGEGWHPDAVLRHAVVGTPVTLFYKKAENSELAALSLIYVNRFFLAARGDDPMWRFTKIELGMNKVFTGTPDELAELVVKIFSGRSKPPTPNAQLKPWTKDALDILPLPPREGEAWTPFEPGK
jgi:hypothetical protein